MTLEERIELIYQQNFNSGANVMLRDVLLELNRQNQVEQLREDITIAANDLGRTYVNNSADNYTVTITSGPDDWEVGGFVDFETWKDGTIEIIGAKVNIDGVENGTLLMDEARRKVRLRKSAHRQYEVVTYYGSGGGSSFDANYQAVLDFATGGGYTLPSASEQILQNQLVLDLKAAGIWNKLDVLHIFATQGDSDFATINWIDPNNFQFTKVNSPSFGLNGFTGNGSSSYLNSNYRPLTNGSNFTLNSASFGLWMHANSVGTTYQGAREADASDIFTALYREPGGAGAAWVNAVAPPTSVASYGASKLIHANRNGDTQAVYGNGAPIGSSVISPVRCPDLNIYLLALNRYGTPSFYNEGTVSLSFLGGNLDAEALDFYNAVNTYISSR